MTTYLITGVSKGLGEALADQVIKAGNTVICLSRNVNDRLVKKAETAEVPLYFYPCDLNDIDALDRTTETLMKEVTFLETDELVLINNAGVVEPIKRIGQANTADLARNIQVNLTAPLLLTNWFLQAFSTFNVKKTMVNVSSGAAQHPYDGWTAYCSSKAGLDMMTRAVALEQAEQASPAHIISFSPGVMDTEMQGQIRSSDVSQFSNVQAFRDYKERGHLRSPELVASKLLELLDTSLENGRVYSIQELV